MKLMYVITPCFNEELNIERCYTEVRKVLESMSDKVNYVHLFSDNASTDGSLNLLRKIAASDSRVRVLVNSNNVGPFRNMASALKHVPINADLVVPMVPADLQDPPNIIPQLFDKLIGDISIIYGVRKNRRESRRLKFARGIYYRLLHRLGATTPPAHAGEFMLITRDVAEYVNSSNEEYPYIRGLVAKSGYPFDVVSYNWEERTVGQSRNSWMDLLDQGLNGLIKTTRTPARLAIIFGLTTAVAGFGLAFFTLFLQILGPGNSTQGIPTVLIAMSVLGGSQLIFLGVIGEYILDIHTKLHSNTSVRIIEQINF